jgi:Bacterial Ig-like domain (group 1)
MTPRLSSSDRAKRPASPTVLHGAGKWITAIVTTGAALAALLVNAQNLGLGAWLGAHGLGFADYVVSRVVVTPRVDTLFAIGDSLPLTAAVTDRRGAAIVGSSLTWHAEDSSVAAVDSGGTVVARGPGTTRVLASVHGLTSAATVTVRQRTVRVAISGDTVVRLPEGESVQLVASALDARGYRVHDRVPRWTSGDSSVAAVDSSGAVTARLPGHTVLSAALGDFAAHASVEVVLSPTRLMLESGDAQRVPAGRRVPQPIVVRVLSRSGRPVPGVAVTFRPDDPDAGASPLVDTTDRVGRARTTWTLSSRPGRQHLAASVDGVDSALVVAVEADPVPRNTRVTLAGEPPQGRVGAALPQPVVVRVTDSTGAALADVPVIWDALNGGRLEPLADRTDSAGEARARWTLGARAGAQRAQVRVGNPRTMPPFVIAATAAAGDPQTVTLLAGDNQTGEVGAPLSHDIVLAVADQYGNPVPRVAVVVRPRDGTVPDTLVATDTTGRVTLRWTLGRRAGSDLLRLRARGVDSLLTVVARAEALPAANLVFTKAITSGTRGRALAATVAASDAYGNPVPNVLVIFSVSAGTLSAARVMTDAKGQAGTHWTPGAPPDQTITAAVRGTSARATQTVRVAPRSPAGSSHRGGA